MAKKWANVQTHIDMKLKEEAEAVLDKLGISLALAVRLYFVQIAKQRRIPFLIELPPEEKED